MSLWLFVPTDPGWIRARVAAFGTFAPVAFVVLQAVQVLVAPIPGQVLGGVAGYLFGGPLGAAYSLLGVLIGSTIAFGLTRRYGRPYAERVLDPERLAKWDQQMASNGLVGLFVLFLLPTFPDDLLCFVAGLSEIRLRTFLVLVLVGRAPSFVAVAYAGTSLEDGRFALASLLVAALALVTTLVLYKQDRVVTMLS